MLRKKLIELEIIDGNKMGPKATTTHVKNLCGTGPLRSLGDKHTDVGNVWLYSGPLASPDAEPEPLKQPCGILLGPPKPGGPLP